MNRFYFVRARPDTDTGAPARARPRNEFNFLLSNLVSSFYTMRGRTHTHTHTHARTHARRHALRHARQHATLARTLAHTHTHTHTTFYCKRKQMRTELRIYMMKGNVTLIQSASLCVSTANSDSLHDLYSQPWFQDFIQHMTLHRFISVRRSV